MLRTYIFPVGINFYTVQDVSIVLDSTDRIHSLIYRIDKKTQAYKQGKIVRANL